MIKKLINDLMKAKTSEELLSYKPQLLDLYDSLYKRVSEQGGSITNFNDIKMLHDLESPMMAYFGPYFFAESGIPFLKEYNPETIDILELIVIFYSIQIMELLENGFFYYTELCIYKDINDVMFDHIEKTDLTKYRDGKNVFLTLWFYFMKVITINDDTREFIIDYGNNIDTFYLSDDKYREVLEMTYENYKDSDYSYIVRKILGIYKLRFTNIAYILNYQPLFVSVGYKYLFAII